jgi:NAD(P)H-hydrate epimerase
MCEALPETVEGTLAMAAIAPLQKLLEGKSAVVLGPGLSRHSETAELVRYLVSMIEVPVVLDADGLNAFEGHSDQLENEAGLILTPHPGEMARITGVPTPSDARGRLQAVRSVAQKHHAVVVLKGHRSLTASPTGEVWVNTTGNPGMAKGGSGDILSGMIAATLRHLNEGGFSISSQSEEMRELVRRGQAGDVEAQRILEERFHAAMYDWAAMFVAAAVYLHGMAGDIARDLRGEYSLVATDIAENIGSAIRVCREEARAQLLYLQR